MTIISTLPYISSKYVKNLKISSEGFLFLSFTIGLKFGPVSYLQNAAGCFMKDWKSLMAPRPCAQFDLNASLNKEKKTMI